MKPATFSLRSARSGSLMLALGAVIVIETVALHLLLAASHPWIAIALTLGSVSALAWLALDYRALGQAHLALDDHALHVQAGRRASFRLERSAIVSMSRPGWRDLPEPNAPEARSYVNLTKPSEPNLLLKLHTPMPIVLLAGIRKRVDRIALHVDEPDAVIFAFHALTPEAQTSMELTAGESQR